LTREGSEKGCWQASVTAEDSWDWTEAGTSARSPDLMRWQASANRGHAAMSRCKPLLSAGRKSHQAKSDFNKMVLNSGGGRIDLPPKHGRWVWQNQ